VRRRTTSATSGVTPLRSDGRRSFGFGERMSSPASFISHPDSSNTSDGRRVTLIGDSGGDDGSSSSSPPPLGSSVACSEIVRDGAPVAPPPADPAAAPTARATSSNSSASSWVDARRPPLLDLIFGDTLGDRPSVLPTAPDWLLLSLEMDLLRMMAKLVCRCRDTCYIATREREWGERLRECARM